MFTLRNFLPYQLAILSRRVSGTISREYSERFGLSINEWRVLAVLQQNPESSGRYLCDVTQLDKMVISRSVRTLEDKGLVLRRVSERDKRENLFSLTPAGENTYNDATPLALSYEERLLGRLSQEEKQSLQNILHKLSDAIEHTERA